MNSTTTSSAPRKLITLAHCFDYPDSALAQSLNLELSELEHNHIRLFINSRGGVKAPPYAGCYLDDQDRRRFMIDFNGLCLKHGIELDDSQPPDHIPAMLEVLALLLSDPCGTSRQKSEDKTDPEGGKRVTDPEIQHLLDTFYRHWPNSFSKALARHDESGFYAATAAEMEKSLNTLRCAEVS